MALLICGPLDQESAKLASVLQSGTIQLRQRLVEELEYSIHHDIVNNPLISVHPCTESREFMKSSHDLCEKMSRDLLTNKPHR